MERDRPPPYRQRAVIKDGYKLVFIEMVDMEKTPEGSRGTHVRIRNVFTGTYMYDLNKDPGETRDIYDESDPKALELLGLLAAQFGEREDSKTEVQLDEKLIKKLRSLGYLK
jgi:hypothetical protein